MNDNLRHWDALRHVEKGNTTPFSRPGGFRGTAIRPIAMVKKLTEHFGPCGIGWGMYHPDFQLVPAGNEILVYCILRCWYSSEGVTAECCGVGGDKVLVQDKNGLRADDEAFKKAFTDALGNAFLRVGASADVHMGLFDGSKYVPTPSETARSRQTEEIKKRLGTPGMVWRVTETEMPGGALYEPGAETEAEVADAKLVADARIAAGQGRDALHSFCKSLSKSEYASIKALHETELLPLARKQESAETRELQSRLRDQLEETLP